MKRRGYTLIELLVASTVALAGSTETAQFERAA